MRVSQEQWQARKIERIPDQIADEMLDQHKALVGKVGSDSASPYFIANQWLSRQSGKLNHAHIWSAYDEGMLRDTAENWARAAAEMPMLTQRENFALWHGVDPPKSKTLAHEYEPRAARLADPKWWRRQLRKIWTRASENAVRSLGVVRKGKMPYASDDAIAFRRQMRWRGKQFTAECLVENEAGEQFGLDEIAEKSLANPVLRRGEFMTRVRGFEEFAIKHKHVPLFFTLTTPSRFHCQLAEGGRNPSYDHDRTEDKTVRDAQRWLCRTWARARASLHRKGIHIYGFRVAEPHHDGTPHWHGLFFVPARSAAVVSDVISGMWLKESPDEPGAREHRVRVDQIDVAKGSATGYLAKYIAKNIDGAGAIGVAQDDETQTPVSDSLARVDAWAAIHGIRQFQQIGGVMVGLWREARRLREPVTDDGHEVDYTRLYLHQANSWEIMERVRQHADRGDWNGFCQAITFRMERSTTVQLWREETGARDRYGGCRPARILGLRCCGSTARTREHTWEIRRKGQGASHRDRKPAACGTVSGSATDADSTLPGSSPESVSESSPPPLPALGPVAITVRGRLYRLIKGGNPNVPANWIAME